MPLRRFLLLLPILLAVLAVGQLAQAAPSATGTAFTYQGRLTDGARPAAGLYDFVFTLYPSETGGSPVGQSVTLEDVTVASGLFTVKLDFGISIFNATPRFLDVAVRPGSSTGSYTTLTPRQELTPTPYAISADNLAGKPADAFWQLGGNTTASSAPVFIGTLNNAPLTIGVSNTVSLQLIPTSDAPNIVAGHPLNAASVNVVGATISGGGGNGVGATSWANLVLGDYGTVAGGARNEAGLLTNVGTNAFAFIGGGYLNKAPGSQSVIAGGANNVASGNTSTVAGGNDNQATGLYSSILGGNNNQAAGAYSTVLGGNSNQAAGANSVVAGQSGSVSAAHPGTFLYADTLPLAFTSAVSNEFAVRASGGFRLVTGVDGAGVPTTGCTISPGGGTWNCTSNVHAKKNFASLDPQAILAGVVSLPIQRWSYIGQDDSIVHVGPTAQDFRSAFGLGENDTQISMVDTDGVALASIQGLYQLVQEKDERIATLEQQVKQLQVQQPSAALAPAGISVAAVVAIAASVSLLLVAVGVGICVVLIRRSQRQTKVEA